MNPNENIEINPNRFKNSMKDACDVAFAVLGVMLMASLVGYVQTKTRAAKEASQPDTKVGNAQYVNGYRSGYADGYGDAWSERSEPIAA